jgi:transcriptional regulator with XRE-family HTH domain
MSVLLTCQKFLHRPLSCGTIRDVIDREAEFNRALGMNIRRLRGRMTQLQLAEAVALPRTSLVLVEKGEQPIRAYTLVRFAEALGTTLDGLLPLTTPPAPAPHPTAPRPVREWVTRLSTTPTLTPPEGAADAENEAQPYPRAGRTSSRDAGGKPASPPDRPDRRRPRDQARSQPPRRRR